MAPWVSEIVPSATDAEIIKFIFNIKGGYEQLPIIFLILKNISQNVLLRSEKRFTIEYLS